jgi:hypothetical protein
MVSSKTVSTFLLISQLPEVLQYKNLTFLIFHIHVDNKNVIIFYPSCIFGLNIHEDVIKSINETEPVEPTG